MVVMGGPGSTDVTSFLMSETRQQNTEIRLSVGKVADKVDQLSSKVRAAFRDLRCAAELHSLFLACLWQIDDLQRQAQLSAGVSSMPMETSIILHNIQRIVQVQRTGAILSPESLSCSGTDLLSFIGRRMNV